MISIPFLLPWLHQQGKNGERLAQEIEEEIPDSFKSPDESVAVKMATLKDNRWLESSEIDMCEGHLQKLRELAERKHNTRIYLDLKEIRKFSYPALFYKDVRNALMHEFLFGERAVSDPIAPVRNNRITYMSMTLMTEDEVYRLNDLEDLNDAGKVLTQVYFPVQWLIGLTRTIARTVAGSPKPKLPEKWWLDAIEEEPMEPREALKRRLTDQLRANEKELAKHKEDLVVAVAAKALWQAMDDKGAVQNAEKDRSKAKAGIHRAATEIDKYREALATLDSLTDAQLSMS